MIDKTRHLPEDFEDYERQRNRVTNFLLYGKGLHSITNPKLPNSYGKRSAPGVQTLKASFELNITELESARLRILISTAPLAQHYFTILKASCHSDH